MPNKSHEEEMRRGPNLDHQGILENTGHNTSAFIYQQPTTDQRALANGNRHFRQKQDGGNKKEGGEEWALFPFLIASLNDEKCPEKSCFLHNPSIQGSSVVTHTTKAISSVTQVLLCCHPKHAPAVLLHWVLYQYKIENRQSYNIKANSRIDDVNGSSDEERPLSTSIFPTDYVPLLSKLFSDKLHLPPPQVPDPRLEPSTPLNTSIIKEDLSPSKEFPERLAYTCSLPLRSTLNYSYGLELVCKSHPTLDKLNFTDNLTALGDCSCPLKAVVLNDVFVKEIESALEIPGFTGQLLYGVIILKVISPSYALCVNYGEFMGPAGCSVTDVIANLICDYKVLPHLDSDHLPLELLPEVDSPFI
ncbi:hypothetical protein J6590_099442 [Homalodisca vitripennis]|nr:hypothetical protein J6590_099442 [Homalodisca vitripennis]